MTTIQLQTDPVVELVLEGEVAIASAAELREELGSALRLEKDICVSLERASVLDITAVQLLWAAAHQARRAGRRFTFAGSVPQAIIATLTETGIPVAWILEGES